MTTPARWALCAAALLFSSLASAVPVSWQFVGANRVAHGGESFFGFGLAPGERVAIDFTFEESDRHFNLLTSLTLTARNTVFDLPLTSNLVFFDAFQLGFIGWDSVSRTLYSGGFDNDSWSFSAARHRGFDLIGGTVLSSSVSRPIAVPEPSGLLLSLVPILIGLFIAHRLRRNRSR